MLRAGSVGCDIGKRNRGGGNSAELNLRLLCGFFESLHCHFIGCQVEALILLEFFDKPVDDSLIEIITAQTQRRLIEQKFSSETAEEDIERFYNANERLFVLDESLLRGLFLKISNKSHDLSDIRKLYTRQDDESFEEIEKYSIRNAARCEFFYDNWRTVAEIEVLLPPLEKPLETMLKDNGSFEFKDEEYIYLLNVSEFAPKGGIEPLDHARSRIRGLLINSNEVSYMRKIKEDLYDAAIEKNRIIFHQ